MTPRPWAGGFLAGLLFPSILAAMSGCVAEIETLDTPERSGVLFLSARNTGSRELHLWLNITHPNGTQDSIAWLVPGGAHERHQMELAWNVTVGINVTWWTVGEKIDGVARDSGGISDGITFKPAVCRSGGARNYANGTAEYRNQEPLPQFRKHGLYGGTRFDVCR